MNRLTPLQLQMLLHYYVSPEPYAKDDRKHANSPAVFRQRTMLVSLGLLEEAEKDDEAKSGYHVTQRGRAHVKGLCELRLPVQVWLTPDDVTDWDERATGSLKVNMDAIEG